MWVSEVIEIVTQEAVKKPLLFEDCPDLTSPTSNHIPDIYIAVSVTL